MNVIKLSNYKLRNKLLGVVISNLNLNYKNIQYNKSSKSNYIEYNFYYGLDMSINIDNTIELVDDLCIIISELTNNYIDLRGIEDDYTSLESDYEESISKINDLESVINDLESKIDDLESEIEELKEEIE